MDKIPTNLPKEITDKYDINRNTFIRKDKGEVNEEREVEVGDVLQDDFVPQLKLKQWDNETNMSVRLIDEGTDKPKIETEGNKIKFIKNKLEAHFYEVDKNFEFEIILKEKPISNKIEMSIETKGLKFYYQPSLKEEHKIGEQGAVEITDTDVKDKDGKVICHRPENIVGSYAVYHESKQGDYSKMGLKNYRAGKAFHIYRPKIIDNAGKEVWGKLNITDNLLTVEIPQEFLDNAVYPVIVDPTFGHDPESYGESNTVIATAGGNNCYYKGTKYNLSQVGTPTALTFYIRAINSANPVRAKAAIHNSDGSSKEEESASLTVSSTGWKERAISGASELSAADYVLGVMGNGNDCENFKSMSVAYDTGAANTACYESPGSTYAVPATVGLDYDYEISIYCTYTAGGATQKEVTDVGSGAEAVSVKCQTAIQDSGAGADTAAILASMNLTDTGSGADTISITQLKSILETGSGADLISLIAKLEITDSGAGAEIITLLGKIALTDTGAGSEALSILSQLAITDTGSGADAINILVQIALTDTGAGSDAVEILNKIIQQDTGSGTETIQILSQLAIAETGSGTDEIFVKLFKTITDSGTGADAISILVQIALTDSGAGSEAIIALVGLSVSDSGTGTEIINILYQILQTDSGSGAEVLEILRKIAVSDSGVAIEAITILVQLAVSEVGNGADVINISGNVKEIFDAGTGSEALNILVEMSITDSGVGSEILNILNQIVLDDTGSGADAITVLGQIALTDSGSGSEALEILIQIAVSESGLGTEALEILVQVALSDTGTGIEALNILNQLAISESGSGADAISKMILDTKEVADSGTGSDVVAFSKQILLLDSGVGTDSVMKQKITAAIATILSSLVKKANIKLSGQIKTRIKTTLNKKANIKLTLNK